MRRPVWWRELTIALVLFGFYLVVDSLNGEDRKAAAARHGHQIFSFERHLHLDVEHTLNNWLAPHHTLATLANYEYAYTYILSALAMAIWVWVRHPGLWWETRDSFVVLNVVAIATFWLYPAAPPRMLSDLGFIDTVSRGGTIGSWGSGVVDTANQVAAMPSLHFGWALWVSVILARITARRSVQLLSAAHVLLTLFVVLATANHYLLDAVMVVVPVTLGVWYADARHRGPAGEVVASCDAFFLHVEGRGAAQHVGGYVVFGPEASPTTSDLRELVFAELVPQRRFHQRLLSASRWRRMRWVDTEVDFDQHFEERFVTGGQAALNRVVAEYAERPLPRDRPLWRFTIARDTTTGRSAVVFLVHHAMADGIGTIIHSLSLFRPKVSLGDGDATLPGPLARTGAVLLGLGQLATDGRARRLPPGTAARGYGIASLDLEAARTLAREHHVRVTDVVLGLTAEAVRRTHPDLAGRLRGTLRVAVPLMVRPPGAEPEGNATAAVMVDLPLDGRSFPTLLAEIGRRTRRLRTPTRAIASRFVMATGLRLLPEPCAGWFARTVYGGAFFHGIVSNLPGPSQHMTMAGVEAEGIYPILPVAPGAPFALGAMSWDGDFGWGLATDLGLLDADAVTAEVARLARELSGLSETLPDASRMAPGESEEEARA